MVSSHEILFKTNVGSHMWKMNNEDSDLDVFECYILETREILKGRVPTSHFTQDIENKIDTQRQEISKVTSEIIKSNLNYIGYIFSPIVLEGNEFLERYRILARRVISKQVYFSVRGMAYHNYRKYHDEVGDKLDERKWNKIVRVLKFGTTLMRTGEIEFSPITGCSIDCYDYWLNALDDAKEIGELQYEPNEEDVNNLWNFVIDERIKRL